MNINNINSTEEGKQLRFKGRRIYRNAVAQLSKNNAYSLTEPNQRFISNAIKELGKVAGEKNIKFLLDTAAQVKYSTNFVFKNTPEPKNNWRGLLIASASAAAAISGLSTQEFFNQKVVQIGKKHTPAGIELEILKQRKTLLESVDLEQIKKETKGTIQDFQRNLDYLLISSETTREHKKYILERLNYFMSDEYEINPQLKDKKSIAVAEMVNDMTILVPGNEIPNMKSVDQKSHGICAAISIVRKKIAYEDKPNYVDAIISELDSSDVIEVYDRSKLGTKQKTTVEKVPVNFDEALKNGFRIIDASVMHWMQISKMVGINNVAYSTYIPFDSNEFGIKSDKAFYVKFEDPQLSQVQNYYQTLIEAKDIIEKEKARKIKRDYKKGLTHQNFNKNIATLTKISNTLESKISEHYPELSTKEIASVINGIISLEKKESDRIAKDDKFSYIPNEETKVKLKKIKNYVIQNHNIKELPDKLLLEIFDLINYYKEIKNENNTGRLKQSQMGRAISLYDTAKAFREQVLAGLDVEVLLTGVIRSEKLQNKEALIGKTIETLINKLETNSPHSDLIISQLEETLDSADGTKEGTIAGLKSLKEDVDYLLTEGLDDIYRALTLDSRKEALENYLNNAQLAVTSKDKLAYESFSTIFGVEPSRSNAINAIESAKTKLKNGGEKEYNQIFDTLGNTSQIKYVQNLYNNIVEKFQEQDNTEIVLNFLQNNNLNIADDPNAVVDRLNAIRQKISDMENFFQNCTDALRIVDRDGDVLFSADPKDIIIKRLESQNRILPVKDLRELKVHIEKYLKARDENEFGLTKSHKIDKKLRLLSDREKRILNNIEDGLNPMYSYVQKQMAKVLEELSNTLPDLNRHIGLNTGNKWNHDAQRGLRNNEELRILEYITGRPHHIQKDFKEGFEKIKTSPYSGVTNSSVSHTSYGGHAQYIADISPVKIKVEDSDGTIKEIEKDVLFHDNTWGPMEHGNTWIDSKGIKRTDYGYDRGGILGYVTNTNFHNGNFVDRILNEMTVESRKEYIPSKVFKKISPGSLYEYKTRQYENILMDGLPESARSVSDKIYDEMFLPSTYYLAKFDELIEQLSSEELSQIIKRNQIMDDSWYRTYKTLFDRIQNKFDKDLSIKENYDNLADNDPLKVALEKIALKLNYQIAGQEAELAKIKDIRSLSKFKALQKNRAINNFKYAFSKHSAILKMVADNFTEEDDKALEEIIKKYNLPEEQVKKIPTEFGYESEKFNGSAKRTINLLMNDLNSEIQDVITNKEALKEIQDFFRKFFTKTIYFSKKDLNTPELKPIIKFIDRVFDPIDDDEFVKIYREIQNMTNEEFKSKILSKVTNEDLGIKSITGHEVLKELKSYNDKYDKILMNSIYFDSIVQTKDYESPDAFYRYKQFHRIPMFKPKNTINELYQTFENDLFMLTRPKLYKPYKDDYLKNNSFPAYPKLEYITDSVIDASFNTIVNTLMENINTVRNLNNQIKSYSIIHKLNRYMEKFTPESIPSDYQYKNINLKLGELITINYGDATIADVIEACEALLEIPAGTPWSAYMEKISFVIEKFSEYENTSPTEILNQVKEERKLAIKKESEEFLKGMVQTRYQANIKEKLNQLEQALIKNNEEKAQTIENELYSDFRKYHILQKPSELLEKYVRSKATGSDTALYALTYRTLLERGLTYAKLANIQTILMDSLDKGIAMSAKKFFDRHKVGLNGEEFSMGSIKVISQMVHTLLIDDERETALMFLDKLGLSEEYVEHIADSFAYDVIKRLITEAHYIALNFKNFKDTIDSVLEDSEKNLSETPENFIKIIDKTKRVIRKAGKNFSIDKESLSILLTALDNIKVTCIQNENANKKIVYNAVLTQAKGNITGSIRNLISNKLAYINSSNEILKFVNDVPLKATSPAYQKRNELNEKFQDLAEYKAELDKAFEEKDFQEQIVGAGEEFDNIPDSAGPQEFFIESEDENLPE